MRSEEVRKNMQYPPEFKKTLMTGRLIGAAMVSSLFLYQIPLQNTLRLAAGMNACLAEGVVRGTGKSPLSA